MARATRFGTLVQASGWACFAFALVLQTLTPALLGLALVALATLARPPAVDLRATRTIPSGTRADDEVLVETRVESDEPAPLFLVDPPPPTLRLLSIDAAPGRGRATQQAKLRVDAGAHRWATIHVRVQDTMGLSEEEIAIPRIQLMEVAPSREPVVVGERTGVQSSFGRKTTQLAVGDPEREIDGLREYLPGDRFRDIDWAHSTKLGDLVVREMRPRTQMPILVVLQAGVALRWKRRVSKLGTLSKGALAILAAAHRSKRPAGFVTWTEWGVATALRPTTDSRVMAGAIQQISALPHSPAPRRLGAESGALDLDSIDAGEREFLDASSSFDPAPSGASTPIESALAAIHRLCPQPTYVVLLLDAEESPATVEAFARRLLRHEHHLIVVCPANAAHHYAKPDLDTLALEHAVRWRRNREETRSFCAARRIPFIVLGPQLGRADMEEVVRSIR